MTPIEKVITQVDDPCLRLVGAKILSLLTDIVEGGQRTADNMEQLQLFADMADLQMSAWSMAESYGRQHGYENEAGFSLRLLGYQGGPHQGGRQQ